MYGHMKKKMAYGGIAEQESKRTVDYDGNVKENEDMEKFAHGGKVGHGSTKHSVSKMAHGGMSHMAEGGKAKPAMLAIIAKLKKKPEGAESEPPPPEMGEGEMEEKEEGMEASKEGKMAAAGEMIDALKSGDKAGFASALENFMKMCEY